MCTNFQLLIYILKNRTIIPCTLYTIYINIFNESSYKKVLNLLGKCDYWFQYQYPNLEFPKDLAKDVVKVTASAKVFFFLSCWLIVSKEWIITLAIKHLTYDSNIILNFFFIYVGMPWKMPWTHILSTI